MAEYRVYRLAQQREDVIWDYTVQRWGNDQAVKYIRGLHNHFSRLANREIRWKPLPKDRLGGATVYLSRYEKHYILFREISIGIGILTLLHTSMDLSERLAEDLRNLEN